MDIQIARRSSMHMHACINYASMERCVSQYAYIEPTKRPSFKHAHTTYAPIMHIPIAVLSIMCVHVCIKYAYIDRSYLNHARTCMHQV